MNSSCQTFQEEMGAYLYEEAPLDFQEHLKTCSLCEEKFQEFKDTLAVISPVMPTVDPSLNIEMQAILQKQLALESKTLRSKSSFWYMLAAASIFFVLGFWIGQQQSFVKENSAKNVATKNETKENIMQQRVRLPNRWLTPEGIRYLKYGKKAFKTE